jgi:hypothetical protein
LTPRRSGSRSRSRRKRGRLRVIHLRLGHPSK